MTAARTASQLGSANRRRGIQAERDLARWLRGNGWPHAERAVRTGFRAVDRTSPDPGDIAGTPGVVWSVKDCAVEQIRHWMAELDEMGDTASDVRLLATKRRGHADPGRWWCWMRLQTLDELRAQWWTDEPAPLRMELGHVVPLLRAVGYGEPVTA